MSLLFFPTLITFVYKRLKWSLEEKSKKDSLQIFGTEHSKFHATSWQAECTDALADEIVASIVPVRIDELDNIASAHTKHALSTGDRLTELLQSSDNLDLDDADGEPLAAKRVDVKSDDDDDQEESLQVDVLNDSFLSLEESNISDVDGGLAATQIYDCRIDG